MGLDGPYKSKRQQSEENYLRKNKCTAREILASKPKFY